MSRNKNPLLSYHLDQLESGFVFQIVEQDDQVTNYVKRVGTYEASNGWQIIIDKQPEIDLDNKVIFLRGRKTHKDEYMHRNQNIGSNKEVKKICQAIDRAMMDLVKDAKGGTRRPFHFYDTFVVDLREFDLRNHPCIKNDNRIIVVR